MFCRNVLHNFIYMKVIQECSSAPFSTKVLVMYGKKGEKVHKRWHVCIEKIENVSKYMCKFGFRDLVNNQDSSGFFVDDIADLQVQCSAWS